MTVTRNSYYALLIALASCQQSENPQTLNGELGENTATVREQEHRPLDSDFEDLFRYGDTAKFLYENHRDGFDRFGAELDQDPDYEKIYCDTNRIEGLKVGQSIEDALPHDVSARYRPLCEFYDKVAATRTSRGTRFPISAYEVGDSFVAVYLDRRNQPDALYPECAANSYEESRGRCDIVLDSKWSIGYRWEPFCRDYMQGELDC